MFYELVINSFVKGSPDHNNRNYKTDIKPRTNQDKKKKRVEALRPVTTNHTKLELHQNHRLKIFSRK